MRHALIRYGTIPIINEGEKEIPIDIMGYRVIEYSTKQEKNGPENFKKELENRIKAFDEAPPRITDNPVHSVLANRPSKTIEISWEEYWQQVEEVVNRLKKIKKEGEDFYKPDTIIGLSNGGMMYADLLIHTLFKNTPITSVWIDRSEDRINLKNEFNSGMISGLRLLKEKLGKLDVLIVDDFIGSGRTIEVTLNYLGENVPGVRLCCLTLFCANAECFEKKHLNLLWFNEQLKDYMGFDQKEICDFHVTNKYLLPYGKDMRTQY